MAALMTENLLLLLIVKLSLLSSIDAMMKKLQAAVNALQCKILIVLGIKL